jgi:hypothetical protein
VIFRSDATHGCEGLPDRAGVRKPPKEETAVRKGAGAVCAIYGDLRITDCRGRPFERGLIERSRDLVVEGRLWRRRRDRFWAVLGPWPGDRIAISNKTPARWRMGSGEEERLCSAGAAGYRS